MISALFIVSAKGEVLCSRHYRSDISKKTFEAFAQATIASKLAGTSAPVVYCDNATFIFTRHKNIFFVAATKGNSNVACILEFLYQKIRILKAYLGEEFDESAITAHITLMFELLDETLDFGYPQNCSVDVLTLYINTGTAGASSSSQTRDTAQLTSQITGAIDWRREGIKHRKNEIYTDINESVNLLMSSNGGVLRSDVSGQVMMRTMLTGMPECKFGLNDKLVVERDASRSAAAAAASAGAGGGGAGAGGAGGAPPRRKPSAVSIDDCTFHRCVRLGKFDAERTITFIPPDGEFELMRYRVTENVRLPFKVKPNVQTDTKNKLTFHIQIKADFPGNTYADNVVVKIPTPPNTSNTRIQQTKGRAKYEPEQKAIVWRIKRFPGMSEHTISVDIDMITATREKVWTRPPISLDFSVSQFASSGVNVQFLKVYDKAGYTAQRWVKYITRAGD